MAEAPKLSVRIGDLIKHEMISLATGVVFIEEIGTVTGFPKWTGDTRSVEIVITEHDNFVGCHSELAQGHVIVIRTKDGLLGSVPSVVTSEEFIHHISKFIEGETHEKEILKLSG